MTKSFIISTSDVMILLTVIFAIPYLGLVAYYNGANIIVAGFLLSFLLFSFYMVKNYREYNIIIREKS